MPEFDEVPRVLVVEDEDPLRAKYVACLVQYEIQCVEAKTLAEASYHVMRPNHALDAAVLDVSLPDGCGVELIRPLLMRTPTCRSVIITGQRGEYSPTELAALGAEAYLDKPVGGPTFIRAVRATIQASHRWRAHIEAETDGAMEELKWCEGDDRFPLVINVEKAIDILQARGDLTHTQVVVAGRLLWGDTNRDIAEFMNCSVSNIQHHVQRVLNKLGAQNRSSLLRVILESSGGLDPMHRIRARRAQSVERIRGSTEPESSSRTRKI